MSSTAPRGSLWLLWAVPLGTWLPLDFLRRLDGLVTAGFTYEVVPIYAWLWAIQALIIGVACLLLAGPVWLASRIVARERLQSILVGASRVLMAVLVLLAIRAWINATFPALAGISGWYWRVLIVSAAAGAIWLTWRQPAPGAGLAFVATQVRWVAMIVAIVLLIDAGMRWRETRPAPRVSQAVAGEHPDVVLISVDTLAADHMSLYGYARPTTPGIDQFAAGATVFEHFYANGNWTIPSVASLMYSLQPWTHRNQHLYSRGGGRWYGHNLLRVLHDAGYEVLAVDTNVLAAPGRHQLLAWVDASAAHQLRVYSSFLCAESKAWVPLCFVDGAPLVHWVEATAEKLLVKVGLIDMNRHHDPDLAMGKARELWTRPTQRPRFLWVHLMAPHAPYAAPPDYLGMFDASGERRTRFDSEPATGFQVIPDKTFPHGYVGRYDESVRMVDDAVTDFLGWLRARNELDGALVAITSDHGESFTPGYGAHGGPMLLDDIIRIPLIIKEPAQTAGRRNTSWAQGVDFAPTLLHLLRLPALPQAEGLALDPGRDETSRPPLFSMYLERSAARGAQANGTIAIIDDGWKYVYYTAVAIDAGHRFGRKIEDALYDLNQDPDEQRSVLAEHPEIAARLKAQILIALESKGAALK